MENLNLPCTCSHCQKLKRQQQAHGERYPMETNSSEIVKEFSPASTN